MRIVRALTRKAQQWIDENVHYESWQLVNGGIAGDWRMIEAIGEAMLGQGFRDSKRWWEFWRKPDFTIA